MLAGCRKSDFPIYPEGYREFAYVANRDAGTVTALDLVYLRSDRTLAVGAKPVALAVNPARDEVYALSERPGEEGSVSVIDTRTNRVAATIPVHRAPSTISVDAMGQRAYVANTGSNSVTVLDLASRRAVATVAAGEGPTGALAASDGRSLVVTNSKAGSVGVYSVNGGSGEPLRLRSVFPGCPGAVSPVILPDSSKAFVACSGGHTVLAIGLAAAPDSWAAKQDTSLTEDHALATLEVGANPSNLTLKPDGGEVFVSNRGSDTISEISTQTNEVGSTYPIGDRPAQGVVSADNSMLWVADSGGDSISLYSIDDGKMVSSLRTGYGPNALAFSKDQHILLAADSRSGDVAVLRTASRLGPALFTLLPAGSGPCAIVVKAMPAK